MRLNTLLGPAIAAIVIGAVLSIFLLVPLIAAQYRIWGTLSLGRLFLILAFIPYLLALPLYTLLPQNGTIETLCHLSDRTLANTHLFRFIDDIRHQAAIHGWRSVPGSWAFLQAFLNVLFFVPLGAFLTRVYRIPRWVVVLIGAGTSLAIELTQLTGNWGLSPCQYRYFDVDDLMLNTFGTIVGIAIAPALALFPGTNLKTSDRERVRPITRKRRFIQLFCDGVIFILGTLAALVIVRLILGLVGHGELERPVQAGVTLLTTCVLFVVIPLVNGGATIGERTVLIRIRRRDGRAAPWPSILIKTMTGWGALGVLSALATLGSSQASTARVLLVILAVAVVLVDPQGMTCWLSGLRRVDERAIDPDGESAHNAAPDRITGPTPRSDRPPTRG